MTKTSSEPSTIRVRGARSHNLKNLSVDIPRHQLVVITGLSGSGKSTLAFDTLYAEGQRRYVESLSAYARQFLQLMGRPDVDSIEGLSPAIAIEQKSTNSNPRSTVGTVTEILDHLRLLFARAGVPHCPQHPQIRLESQTRSQIVDSLLAAPTESKLTLLAPVLDHQKGEHRDLLDSLRAQGYVRARLRTEAAAWRDVELDSLLPLNKLQHHSLEVVIDRLKIRPEVQQRLSESLEAAFRLGGERAVALLEPPASEAETRSLSLSQNCPLCGFGMKALEPNHFSFNSPQGACPSCDGLGDEEFFDPALLVPMPELPLSAGAIQGWDPRNAFAWAMIQGLAAHYGFTPDTPFAELTEEVRDCILQGSGDEVIEFEYPAERGKQTIRQHAFEGVLPSLARRWRETEQQAVREELSRYRRLRPCQSCGGSRLKPESRAVRVGDGALSLSLPDLMSMPLAEARQQLGSLELQGGRALIGERLLQESCSRLQFLEDVGLAYLNLGRSAGTLSGGESQRIRLASQIGAGLSGVMYVLDEPSIGLHQRDNDRLLGTLARLRDLGNTVIVVEHDEDAIRLADHVIDMGPGAGEHGGQIIAEGPPAVIQTHRESLTGKYMRGELVIGDSLKRLKPDGRWLTIRGATGHNLRGEDGGGVTASIPVGLMVCVTGVSGSGKSTLINDTLVVEAARRLNRATSEPSPFEAVEGLEHFDKIISVDQSPIGRTPRSNPATYTGLFATIRDLFAGTPMARERGYEAGRFSFNVKGGRCEACQGDGMIKVEMHFLPDVYVPCDVCKGARYARETLDIRYRGLNIAEVLDLTVEQGLQFFGAVPSVHRRLELLQEVGLSYIRLGQSATTLSGGEAQRVKLAHELAKRDTGRTLYVLDEPTTGLHFHDVALLLRVLGRLRDSGNTLVIIEHNLDVVRKADWVLDLGPEGGTGGGRLVAHGTPEDIMACEASHTGRFLKKLVATSGRP